MKRHIILYMIGTGMLFLSCSHKKNTDEQAGSGDNFITVSQEQFTAGNLSIGKPVKMVFEDVVKCNGYVVTDPSGSARISTPVPGLVNRINCSGGQKVSKGQVLFWLSGNDFIELQKDLAETASQMMRLRSEFERIKSLFDEKIGSEKELIQAESEFKAANARYSALKMKVKLIGLDENKIENGDFYDSFFLKSPINGYISNINIAVGQYADQQSTLAEVYDVSRLQLKLGLFEKDLGNLKENQEIRFYLPGDRSRSFSATLTSTGKNVDAESKTVTCYASIDDLRGSDFANNAYIEAVIVTKKDSVYAIPEESVLRSEGSNYILEYIRNENDLYYLKRTKAEVGRLSDGFAEILNIPEDINLITKGAYSIRIE